MKKLISVLFVLFLSGFVQSQTWQNISYQKGALGVNDIVEDKAGNLYLYCVKGVFTSANGGDNWSKIGSNALSAALSRESTYNPNSKCFLRIWHDTLHLFIQSSYGAGGNNFPYKAIYFDAGKNSWHSSEAYYPNKIGPKEILQNSKMFAFIHTVSAGYQFTYSLDGMKNWVTNPLTNNNAISSTGSLVFNDKFYLFKDDSLFITSDGESFLKKKTNKNLYGHYKEVVNGTIMHFESSYKSIMNGTSTQYLYDSLTIYTFDTTSALWTQVSKELYAETTTTPPSFTLTKSGYLYQILTSPDYCDLQLRRTKTGKTWERISIQEGYGHNSTINTANLKEIGGKTYWLTDPYVLQHLSNVNGNSFQVTAPNDFNYQFAAFKQDFYTSPHYVGNHMDTYSCPSSFLHGMTRWDGTSWQKIARNSSSFLSSSVTYTQHFSIVESSLGANAYAYHISTNEGLSWDTLINPHPRKQKIRITDINKVLYATPMYAAVDTLYVSFDVGKTWAPKKTPSYSLPVGGSTSFLGYYANTLCLYHTNSTQVKRIYTSSDQGSSWTDVTYNLPQNKSIQKEEEKGYVNLTLSKNLVLQFNGANKYYTYQLNEADKSWTVVDSNYFYARNYFPLDTLLRANMTKYAISSPLISGLEISYDRKNWFEIDNYLGELIKGDTLLDIAFLSLNKKGIYAPTNYGLFYLPYPPVFITNLSSDEKPTISASRIYPNPTNSAVFLQTTSKEVAVQIVDLQGKIRLEAASWKGEEALDVSSLEEGLYFVKIVGEQKVIKLLKSGK